MNDKKMWGFVAVSIAILATWTYTKTNIDKPVIKPIVIDKVEAGPTAVITDGTGNTPPDIVDIGDSLILKSDKSITGTDPKSKNWYIDPPDRLSRASLLENGSTVSIPVGRKEGTVKVILITAKGDRSAFRVYTFVVKDLEAPIPTPTPNPVVPVPTPTPVPVPVPMPIDSLAGFRASIDAIPIPTGVTDDEIRSVAKAFKDVAKQIDDGTITTTTSMTGNTADDIRSSIGMNAFLPWIKWRDDVLVAIKNAELKTFKEHSKYWNAVGDVLLTKLKEK